MGRRPYDPSTVAAGTFGEGELEVPVRFRGEKPVRDERCAQRGEKPSRTSIRLGKLAARVSLLGMPVRLNN